jgi:predicted AAA+ superfamily ATPase
VIDETQKEPAVFEKIKYAFDEKSITFEVLLGSSQILLLKKIRESLAGRISLYVLKCQANFLNFLSESCLRRPGGSFRENVKHAPWTVKHLQKLLIIFFICLLQ